MDQTLEILHRARDWVAEDVRVRAALVHGSVVQGRITPMSDVDLIIVAEPGERDAIWAERVPLTRRLLGAPAVTVPTPRLPYRWQARTAELDMVDLTIDEGAVRVWYGFEGPVEFLIDRAGVRAEFERAMAAQPSPVAHDAAAECDATWEQFAKLAGLLLHQRTVSTRIGLNELITSRLLPLLDRSSYVIGTVHDQHDRDLIAHLDRVYPASGDADELCRAIRAAADWYAELLTAWSRRSGRPRPASALERGVVNAVDRLVELSAAHRTRW